MSFCFHFFTACLDASNQPPVLPSYPASTQCVLYDDCMGFECCVNLDLVTSFADTKTWFQLDVCNYKLRVGVGKWFYNTTLFSYKWGTALDLDITDSLRYQ